MNLDLATQTLREINAALHAADGASESGLSFIIEHPRGAHAVAVGLSSDIEVAIRGHVGYYGAGMNQKAAVTIEGRAGPGVAENMMSGKVVVEMDASQYAGASGHGGLLVIKGDASSRCGISMKGIDIVVGGNVGAFSAFMAQTGRLVVCGNAGRELGDSIYEARLYVRGKVESLGSDCVEKKMTAEHEAEVAELLEQAGISHKPSEFRRYGSMRNLYNFKIDNANAMQ